MSKPTQRPSRVVLSIVLVVLLIGCGIVAAGALYAIRQEPARHSAPPPSPLVETIVVDAETVTETFIGYGTAKAHRITRLAAEVTGTVVELVGGLRAGAAVEAGRTLVRLDDRDYREQLKRAEALAAADQAAIDELGAEEAKLADLLATAEQEERLARNEYLRVADLYERKLAAKKEYDFANLAYQQVRRGLQGYQMESSKIEPRRRRLEASREANLAEVARARLNIERCAVRAPFAGSVHALDVEVGDWVGPGTPILTLVDPSEVEIGVQLPGAVYNRLRVGAACRVEAESLPGVFWEGGVARVAPSIDEQTRTFAAYVEVDNTAQPQPCVPGTFVMARVDGPTHVDAVLVPRGAIREEGVLLAVGGDHAGSPVQTRGTGRDPSTSGRQEADRRTSEGQKAGRARQQTGTNQEGPMPDRPWTVRRQAVQVGRLVADRVIIQGGVQPGDRVIVSHLGQLEDGATVRVTDEAAPAARAALTASSDEPGVARPAAAAAGDQTGTP